MSDKNPSAGTRPQGTRTEAEAARRIQQMFSAIAPRYDLLNHLLSFSLDRGWRKRTARAFEARLARPGSRALDLCCGTGDLALELARVSAGRIVGCDFARPMLKGAQGKAGGDRRLLLAEADALRLPFREASFDVVAMAFGFRNLANYRLGLEEIHRVLKRGGEVGILEFALPRRGIFRTLYGFYFRHVLPCVGRVVSGVSGPYSYLPASVEMFPDEDEFASWLKEAGFSQVSYELWTGGTVALHRGIKQ